MHAAQQPLENVTFDAVSNLARGDMEAVDRLISTSLESDVALVSQVSRYIVASGGKRLRPLIVLLAARAFGYEGEQHVRAATIIEFIHTATLLHDDVVDSSSRRRGKESANTVFGNQASVLVGDFLYSRAFQMMVDIGRMRVMQILADATNTIAAGARPGHHRGCLPPGHIPQDSAPVRSGRPDCRGAGGATAGRRGRAGRIRA